jgi:sugar O-acyltransferase (sialic acid O-acetyltransferase NeuD family)
VLFGAGPFASLAWYCLTHDSDREVAGFTVDRAYLDAPEVHGLPVRPFEELDAHFPPERFALLLSLGPHGTNRLRQERYDAAKARGYGFASYVSSRAVTWPDLALGEGSMLFEAAVVQPFASIGVNSIVRSRVHVSHHVKIGDHCFIAAGACFGGLAVAEDRCFVGLNATIRDGVRLAEGSFIAAGAVVAADTEPDGLYVGVPARRVKDLA